MFLFLGTCVSKTNAIKKNVIQQPQVIILKEGTDTSQGKGQLLSNIAACQTIADMVRTTLGPRGMDKLMVDKKGIIQFIQPFYILFHVALSFIG
jgi:T-complex protein 1 subunit eta